MEIVKKIVKPEKTKTIVKKETIVKAKKKKKKKKERGKKIQAD